MILRNVWHCVTQRNIPEHGLHDIKTKVQWSSEAVGTVKDPTTQRNKKTDHLTLKVKA